VPEQHHFSHIQAASQAKTLFSLKGGFVPIFQPFSGGFAAANPNGEAMPAPTPTPNQVITGARRMSLHMLTLIHQADSFAGLPRGTAKPLRFLHGFQEAEPYLGLPAHAFKLVSWLVKQTQGQDWEEGSRPIAWPSARRQQEFLGLSPTQVKALNRALFEAGIFVIRDNEQGKRYGRRGPDGRIIEAFGFDLSPLAQRYDEFIRLAAEAKVERERMKDGRRRVTLARRAIRQIGEQLAELGTLPASWERLTTDTAALVMAAKAAGRSDELVLIAGSVERRQAEAEQWLKEAVQAASKPVETDPVGSENRPHTRTTNLSDNPADTVTAAKDSSRVAAPSVPPSPPPVPPVGVAKELRLKPDQLLDLAPKLAAHVLDHAPGWPDIVDAAGMGLRTELGVSASLWGEACRTMGREQAAVALAIVSTKPAGHFTRGAGGYFAGMVRKAERGELRLERTLWALKDRKWGPRAAGERSGTGWLTAGRAGAYGSRH
jgi:replication initiation protein RepC